MRRAPDCFLNISQAWLRHIITTAICFPTRHSHSLSLGSTIIITSFSAKRLHQKLELVRREGLVEGSKVTARRVLVSNRGLEKGRHAAEHGRSLNGCKHPKPSQVTKQHQRQLEG